MEENNLSENTSEHNMDENIHEDVIYGESEEQSDSMTGEDNSRGVRLFSVVLPAFLALFLISGFANNTGTENVSYKTDGFEEAGLDDSTSKLSRMGLISAAELKKPVMDTVYTDKDVWFELRVEEQHVYQHWRDGRVKKFPVSTGNKFISKSVEARPGIFAIFYRNPHHKSSQFDDASLYHFQTFNSGIGFHSLAGTGYYGNLGVRPSSHGCIRMSHGDAKQMYEDAEMGTLVLVHYGGKHARTIAFAPKGIKTKEYTGEQYKKMLAENLYNVLSGNYYIAHREYFVVDPEVIPRSGIYVGYDKKLPERQKMPTRLYYFKMKADVLRMRENYDIYRQEKEAEGEFKLVSAGEKKKKDDPELSYSSDEELIKKYFHNPIGILPYYPPTPRRTTTYISDNTTSESNSTPSPAPTNSGEGDGQ